MVKVEHHSNMTNQRNSRYYLVTPAYVGNKTNPSPSNKLLTYSSEPALTRGVPPLRLWSCSGIRSKSSNLSIDSLPKDLMDLQYKCPCIVWRNNQWLEIPCWAYSKAKRVETGEMWCCWINSNLPCSSTCELFSAVGALWPLRMRPFTHTSVVMTLTSSSDLDVNKPSTVEQSVFGQPLYLYIQTCKYQQLCMMKT